MGANVTVKSYTRERQGEIYDRLRKNMGKVGAVIERQAKKNVSRTGNEHPQVDTGRLRSSIIYWQWTEPNIFRVAVGTNVSYGKSLEFGYHHNRNGEFIGPYPWLFPAVEMSRDKIVELIGSKYSAVVEGD